MMKRQMRWLLFFCLLILAGCSKEKSTDELIADVKSNDEKDRIIAVRLLPQRKGAATPQIVSALTDALKDKHGDIRWSAAIGLGSLGAEARDAIPALQTAQRDSDGRVREAARVALSRIDPERFPTATQRSAK
jgi:HEAT repeat protein